MDDQITILDGGRTLSLRFANQAHEIVAESSSDAIEALAKMLFEKHARAERLADALRKLQDAWCEHCCDGEQHPDDYNPENHDGMCFDAHAALAADEVSGKESSDGS